MRLLVIAAVMISFSAQAFTVKKCVDGSRSFKIVEDTLGRLTGEFQDFTGPVKNYGTCNRIKRTTNYRCNIPGSYAVYIAREGDKDMVQFNLAGNFGADSGYLFSLYCD